MPRIHQYIAECDWKENYENYCEKAECRAERAIEELMEINTLQMQLLSMWGTVDGAKFLEEAKDMKRSYIEGYCELEDLLKSAFPEFQCDLPSSAQLMFDGVWGIRKMFLEGRLGDQEGVDKCILELQEERRELENWLGDLRNSPYYDPWYFYTGY